MSNIKFKCPQCGQKLEAGPEMFGNMNRCPVCQNELRVPDSRLSPGIQIGNFVLKERIGMGGMGEVWLAEQQPMGRQVALKIMKEKLNDDPSFQKRFAREIRNSGRLNHPNIATAYLAGADNNIQYMAMEYIEGHTLEARIRNGPLSEEKALATVAGVAAGLDYAWNSFKMIHRDIKPSNIMICSDGTIKLLDMGIARSLQEGHQTTLATTTGEIMGTPHYMSPEQAQSQNNIDCRTDIYSLGIVLHEMLTGRPPFDAPSPVEVVAQHIFAPRPDLHLSHNISKSTAAIARKMIEQNPEDRFRDFQELQSAIADPASLLKKTPVKCFKPPRKPMVIAAGICMIAILILLLPVIIRPTIKSEPVKEKTQVNKKTSAPVTVGPLQNLGLSQEQIENSKKIMNRLHQHIAELRRKAGDGKNMRQRKFYYMHEMNKIRKDAFKELKKIMTKEQFDEFQKRVQLQFPENGQ